MLLEGAASLATATSDKGRTNRTVGMTPEEKRFVPVVSSPKIKRRSESIHIEDEIEKMMYPHQRFKSLTECDASEC